MTTMYEHVGGEPALRKFAEHFHTSLLADPLLQGLFRAGSPHHTQHLTFFFIEVLGGPEVYTDGVGGFVALLRAHLGLRITPDQQDRFVTLMLQAADASALPDDERFRTAFESQIRKAAGFTTKVSASDTHQMLQPPYPQLGRWTW
jgi:hemoglobin